MSMMGNKQRRPLSTSADEIGKLAGAQKYLTVKEKKAIKKTWIRLGVLQEVSGAIFEALMNKNFYCLLEIH